MIKGNIGNIIMIVAIIFGFIETWYFGWNFISKSEPESVCNCIALWIFIIGLILRKFNK